ncbi:MAG TPA: tetratricopeptide repeat protein, partial [Pyrinomonadaceae bacterium]|nr:tetratricopeptide repeat protein [Pyrinomonadaceae bacterium]
MTTGDAVIALFLIAVNFDVAMMGLSYIWTTIVVTALLIAIHCVPSLETDVSKDTQKLVSRLIGTLPEFANGWYLSPKEAEPKAKEAALRALELDETLAETHYLLGKIAFWYEWDWATAERHWKRANELDPAYPAYYPVYLAATGRLEEAVKAQEVVQQRLPLDLNVNLDSAGILLWAGRYDQSIEQTRKALELDPDFWWAYQNLGLAYERKKQYPEAIAALEKAPQGDVNPSSLGYLGYVYAAAGKKAEAQKV